MNRRYVLIWNPIMLCFAVVAPGEPSQRIEFDGYGYPGWMYLISCTDKAGRPRALDEEFLRDLTDRTRVGRQTTRHQADLLIRQMFRQMDQANRDNYAKTAEQAWEESKDMVASRLTGRRSMLVQGRKSA